MEKSEFAFVVIGYCCLGLDPEHFIVTCASEFYVNHLKSQTSHFKSVFWLYSPCTGRQGTVCSVSSNQCLLNFWISLCLFRFYNFLIFSRTVNFSGLWSRADTGWMQGLMTHGSGSLWKTRQEGTASIESRREMEASCNLGPAGFGNIVHNQGRLWNRREGTNFCLSWEQSCWKQRILDPSFPSQAAESPGELKKVGFGAPPDISWIRMLPAGSLEPLTS